MTTRRHLVALTAPPLLLAAGLLSAAPAHATPVETGCPSGFSVLSVSWLATQGGYRLPSALDDAGNGNGLVCARAVNESVYDHNYCADGCTVPVIYNFYDDNLTPLH